MAMTLTVWFHHCVHPSSWFTWTQTHQCAAWCCPGGFDAGFCTCLFLPWRSRHAACRSAFSSCRPGLLPTLNSEPRQRTETERGGGGWWETTKHCILVQAPWWDQWCIKNKFDHLFCWSHQAMTHRPQNKMSFSCPTAVVVHLTNQYAGFMCKQG